MEGRERAAREGGVQAFHSLRKVSLDGAVPFRDSRWFMK